MAEAPYSAGNTVVAVEWGRKELQAKGFEVVPTEGMNPSGVDCYFLALKYGVHYKNERGSR
jgi:hypothetical protein